MRSHVLTRSLMLFVPSLCMSLAVHAQSDALAPSLHPATPASTVDLFYALFATNCGKERLDPSHPPVVTRAPPGDGTQGAVESIRIDYTVLPPETTDCMGVFLPDTITAIPLGHLQEGETAIFQSVDNGTLVGHAYVAWAVVGDTPNAAVSGTWFDPEAPGMGISLSLDPDPDDFEPTAVLFLATLSPDGEPLWLTGAGKFDDATLTVPLTRSSSPNGTAPIQIADAGTATFEYLGCGEAVLSVDGVAVRFPSGDAPLRQLTTTYGLADCNPPTTRPQQR